MSRRRSSLLLIIFLSAIGLSAPLRAGSGAWTTGGPYGGQVSALAIDPKTPSTLYAGAGHLYKSTDAGSSWTVLLGDGVVTPPGSTVVIDPVNPTTIYVGAGSGVFKSTNGGTTWTVAAIGPWYINIQAVAIDPAVPSTLYAATFDSGIFRSLDAGLSWSAANSGLEDPYLSSLAVAPSNPSTVYAGSSNLGIIFKSTDSGGTWSPTGPLPPFLSIHALVIDPTTPSTLYVAASNMVLKSTDSGGTWAATNVNGSTINALAVDPTASDRIYAATEYGLYGSTDGGSHWQFVYTGLHFFALKSLAVAFTQPSTVYAGTGFVEVGVIKSTDLGSTWTVANTGLGPTRTATGLALDPLIPGRAYSGGAYWGVFRTLDAGGHWARTSDYLPEYFDSYGVGAVLATAPTNPMTLYAGGDIGLYRSTDEGSTWSAAGLDRSVIALAVDPVTPTTAYAVSRGVPTTAHYNVLKSTDSGATWTLKSAGLPIKVNTVAIASASATTLYAGTPVGVYRSTNAAESWLPTGLPSSSVVNVVVDPTSSSVVYACALDALYKSVDSGATWVPVGVGLPARVASTVVVDRLSPSTLYAGASSGVFKSTNGGQTWLPLRAGLPKRAVKALEFDPTGPTTLYAGVEDRGVWQASPPPPPFLKGDLDHNGAADLVFRSTTNGAQNMAWLMDGVARISVAPIVPDAINADWEVRGVDDVNFDGTNDLVFWNRVTGNVEFWLMNGTTRIGAPLPLTGGAVLDTNWDLRAFADFSGDGRPDIVWRNIVSQRIVIWTMSGAAKVGAITPTPSRAIDANWQISAALDYNGDGSSDFLWYNSHSGRLVTWYLDVSAARISGQFTTPSSAGASNWKVVASGDFSGYLGPGTPPLGSPDIVLRNETSGKQVIWHMDFASTRVHGEFTTPAANSSALGWTIVGPR